MRYNTISAARDQELRNQAQQRMQESLSGVDLSLLDAPTRRLLQQLQARQIELELENAELRLLLQADADAEAARRESEERFSWVYDDMPVMLHSIDSGGRLIGVSNYWLEVLGYRRKEVLGRKSTDFLTEASRRYAEEVVLPEFFKKGFCRNIEYQVVKKNGEILDVVLFASADRNRMGGTAGSLAVMTDVTEWKRAELALMASENRYRMIVETSQEGILALDADARCNYANRHFAEMLGENPADMLGRPFLDFIDGCLHDEVGARLRKREEGVSEHYETIFLRKDGARIWATVSASPVAGADGGFGGSFAMISDVTKRKQAAEEIEVLHTNLSARACELEMANEELETFSYTVSHDLRRPLTAINGFSQVVLEMFDAELNEQCKNYLQEILNGTIRMNHLIDTLLNFSSRARCELRRGKVDLSEMVLEIVEELRQSNPQRRVCWTVAPGVTVEADGQLLQVVLDNLIGNAWKYSAKNPEAAIEFGVTRHKGKPAYFVRDNGAGFDMAQADRLFAPFHRLHGAEEFQGTGIGLASVQRIIQRHGGQVWAEGAIGAGATFHFTLG